VERFVDFYPHVENLIRYHVPSHHTAICHKIFFKNRNISKKLKLRRKNTIIDKTLTYASETWKLTKKDRKKMNIFERKVHRRILGPVYGNEKENWRILTNKETYARVKKPTITGTVRLNNYIGLGMNREWKKIASLKEYYM
jgi:hypothetical protein